MNLKNMLSERSQAINDHTVCKAFCMKCSEQAKPTIRKQRGGGRGMGRRANGHTFSFRVLRIF
jgi:hypothetical protein